jgi:steroid delta-isomerase
MKHDAAVCHLVDFLETHMFEQVRNPRFVVTRQIMQNDDLFLTWDFMFSMPPYSRQPQTMHGATHFRFDAQSHVASHRDYWDAAEEVYEKLPVLGSMMRLLKWIARR